MLWWLAQNSLIAGLLAAAAWLACRLWRPAPAVQHALWLVVLVKLVTPPVIVWPWAPPEVLRSLCTDVGDLVERLGPRDSFAATSPSRGFERSSVNAAESDPPGEVHTVNSEFAPLPDSADWRDEPTLGAAVEPIEAMDWLDVSAGSISPADSLVQSRHAATAEHVPPNRVRLALGLAVPIFFRLWLLGAAGMILLQTVRIIRFCRMTSNSRLAPNWLVRQVESVAIQVGVRPARVVVVPGIRSPFIWCVWRPRLLWPACLTDQTESDRWRGVIAHELAHLRRRDHWVGWLELLAGCIWWWNPLFWYVRYQLRENAELACDALVVSVLPDGRRAYAESLIEVASLVSQTVAPVPAFGVHSVARQAFERRLTMILCERVSSKLSVRAMLAIGILGLVALPGWSLAQVATTPKSQQAAAIADPEATADDPAQAIPVVAVELSVSSDEPVGVTPPGYVTFAVPTVGQAAPGDQRMDVLEKKLEALVDELKALRESRKAPTATGTFTIPAGPAGARRSITARTSSDAQAVSPNQPLSISAAASSPAIVYAAPAQSPFATTTGVSANAKGFWILKESAGQGVQDVQMLSRATYKLPKDKAETLATFLREHMKSPVEAKVVDDSLVITATPEAQTTIGHFIALSEGEQPATTGAASYHQLSRPAQNVFQLAVPQQAAPAALTPSVPAKR